MRGLLGFFLVMTIGGCTSTGGAPFSFSPQHRLLNTTKMVAQRGSPLPLPRELAKEALPAYVVEPGDVLLVTVIEQDEPVILPSDQPVIQDGTIDLGVYGRPVVAGRTLDEVQEIADKLIREKAKVESVTVQLIERESKVFYVLGEVNTPGAFPLAGRETVLDGLLAAGGLSDSANPDEIMLSRPTPPDGCRVVLPICYDEIVQLGDTSTNYQLAPGDRIYVASRGFFDSLFPKSRPCPPCGRAHFKCGIPMGPLCEECPEITVTPIEQPADASTEQSGKQPKALPEIEPINVHPKGAKKQE